MKNGLRVDEGLTVLECGDLAPLFPDATCRIFPESAVVPAQSEAGFFIIHSLSALLGMVLAQGWEDSRILHFTAEARNKFQVPESKFQMGKECRGGGFKILRWLTRQKAPGGRRTPRRYREARGEGFSGRSWIAAAFCRFGMGISSL